jgi:hypothetical protein
MTRARLGLVLFVAASIALGFALTYRGVATWDALPHLDRSRWLVHRLGLPSSRSSNDLPEMMKWYGPLWVLILGLLSEVVFAFLRDPMWVQHACNFALFPIGLYAVYALLRRAGVVPSTAALAVAMIFGLIRLGGHALINVNDFPFAMASLLAMLYLWNKLRELQVAFAVTGRYAAPSLVLLGLVTIVPYLIRPPVLAETAILTAFLGWFAGRPSRGRDRLALWLIPPLSALALTLAAWPSLWERSVDGRMHWRDSFHSFFRFQWVGAVRFFGRTALSTQLPRWYAFVWWPVIVSPVVFGLLLAGLWLQLRNGRAAPVARDFAVESRWGGWNLSLPRWLALHAALLWAGVVLVHPTIYDEERHLLFLYPPVLVMAALGLDRLPQRLKVGLAVLAAVTSLASYGQWGRYAYVYKSPLIGERGASRFMGDYWGVCIPLAVRALPGRVPAESEVVIPQAFDAAAIQYERLRQGRFSGISGFGPYRLESASPSQHAYAILYNRMGLSDRAISLVPSGRVKILWTATMPPGDPACVLVEYSTR